MFEIEIEYFALFLFCFFPFFFFCRAAQAVQIFVALAVFFTFGLQFFVCLEIGWDSIKDNFTKRPTLVNYVMRYAWT